MLEMLTEALAQVSTELAQNNGVIPTGVFSFVAFNAQLFTANANNHQQTWGVLAGAIMALASFMDSYGEFGYANFQIFDGGNQVGEGSVGPAPAG